MNAFLHSDYVYSKRTKLLTSKLKFKIYVLLNNFSKAKKISQKTNFKN